MVSWVATELLRKGFVDGVAHVVASVNPQNDERFFRYQISRTEEEIRAEPVSPRSVVDSGSLRRVLAKDAELVAFGVCQDHP